MSEPRKCFVIIEGQCDENGYIPSLVTEGEPGHAPLKGDPAKFQTPWYWGKTYDEAKETCRKQNEKLGISPNESAEIMLSSMRASGSFSDI